MSFPVYQIDFSAVLTGKRVASSKRRLRWRFGFPNQEAIRNGESGTACRGEEHDVTIIWSITSGKRQISCDGREVHFSTNRAGILEFSWSMKGNHVVKVLAHAMPPVSAPPGFRQYELSVDGQPFHLMPKVYELGVKGMGSGQSPRVPGVYNQTQRAYMPPTQGPADPEDADLQRAIKLSLQESRSHLNEAPAPVAAPPAPSAYTTPPAAPPAAAAAPVAAAYNTGAGAMVPHQTPGPSYNYSRDAQSVQAPQYSSPTNYQSDAASFVSAPPPQSSGAIPSTDFMSQPTQTDDLLNPTAGAGVPPADDPFAPKPPGPTNHYDVANMIMGAYGAPPAPAPGAIVPTTPQNQPPPAAPQYQQQPPPAPQQYQQQPPQQYQQYQQQPPPTPQQYQQPPPQAQYQTPQLTNGTAGGPPPAAGVADNAAAAAPPPPVHLSMNALTLHEDEKKEEKNDVDSAMKKLVNFNDINEEPEDLTLTMKPKEDPNKKKVDPAKSVPLPPKAAGVVHTGASLEQIKTVAPPAPPPNPEKVMSPPPNLYPPGHPANAGALVVHGQGPPPLQKEFVGFGVGAQMRQQAQMQAQMQQQQQQQAAAYGGAPPPPQYYQ